MFSAFVNSFKIPELRSRLLFTLGLVFTCRIVTSVPIPGVDAAELQRAIERVQHLLGGGLLSLFDLFNGGALSQCAVGALGIMPYISASIILQLMTAVIPTLERLAREGDVGRQKITQYTRYLTLAICVVQGFFLAITLENPGALGIDTSIVYSPGWGFRLMAVLAVTTGTMLMMWLGEQITERGIGNGISLIITVNIVSALPAAISQAANLFKGQGGVAGLSMFHLVGMLVMMFLVISGTIAITQATRKIPIHTTKRVVGRKVYGGQNTYMPLKVNYSGVMPIIFAQALLMFPALIFNAIPFPAIQRIGASLSDMGSMPYLTIYGLMILFFSYFWVATQFNPLQIADDLKKNGGYVPGVRPGRPTAEYLDHTMTRITLIGAIALTVIAVIPMVLARQFQIPWLVASFFGGTSLLIIVGVSLDTMRQIESHLLTRHYDGFLKKGRLRGRR
ncbi:MAG: preprotein translocase subunit SecY [Verrucomicrobia bacterium]|nr:preprotein translocase subunit SecY [Verrucomicrobiota bacterium]MDA1085728.1 preprotein translocase subunit SecY [Verrucomicrobiota bacterium]